MRLDFFDFSNALNKPGLILRYLPELVASFKII